MNPISLKEIASIIGAAASSEKMASGAAVDSRLLLRGDLFFALPGMQNDGHSFIEKAAGVGASGAVVSKAYKGPSYGLPLLPVDDVFSALQIYAKNILKRRKASIVAVTGSLGKTTTKDFIAVLLRKKFKISSSPGNSNSQIGLPLAVINHTFPDDEIIILEMGMTMPGQISKLIEIAPPDVAVITTVALVHAENFESLEEIAESKAEIFSHPATKLGIYHLESDIGERLTQSGPCQKLSFSTHSSQADFSLHVEDSRLAISENKSPSFALPQLELPGAHNRHNFLAAVAVARHFGLSRKEIEAAQLTLELPERRLQMIEKQDILFVNDAYNASEMSMKAALDSLPPARSGGRKIAFLGGMVELGKFSEGCHQAVGRHALERVDMMFCFGIDCLPIFEEWKTVGRHVVWARERDELAAALKRELQSGDVVLLKGSRAKGVWKILDEL